MAATAAQITVLRRRCALAAGDTVYTDAVLGAYIESYPLTDMRGQVPWYWIYTTLPPTVTANLNWIPTYDLAAAAADVWGEIASGLAAGYDVSGDGSSRSLSQKYEHAKKQEASWRSRRVASSVRTHTIPREIAEEINNILDYQRGWD